MFEIEQDIPIARDKSLTKKRTHRPEFPFSQMKVGDSFAVRPEDCGSETLIQCQNMVTSAACGYREKHDKYFGYTSRQMNGYVRIWRTA
jgi:hypothetical protein